MQNDGVNKDEFSLKNLRDLRVLRMEACVNISDVGLSNDINFD